MNQIKIIRGFLTDKKYDGLANVDMECGCEKNDLWPCESPRADCQPAFKKYCNICGEVFYSTVKSMKICNTHGVV